MRLLTLCIWALWAATAAPILAATVYNEAVSGDLSNNGLAPTALSFSPGSNQLLGTTGRVTATDRDYFTITVPTGYQIGHIIEQAGTQAGGVSFFGVEAGPQLTVLTSAVTADGLLGWTHYAATSTDLDILPAMRIPDTGSSGFTTLNAGQYTFWIQDFTPGAYNYSFDIQLTPAAATATPEPSTWATSILALVLLILTIRRVKKTGLF